VIGTLNLGCAEAFGLLAVSYYFSLNPLFGVKSISNLRSYLDFSQLGLPIFGKDAFRDTPLKKCLKLSLSFKSLLGHYNL